MVLGFLTKTVIAGGSGLNVAVIVNQNSTNSVQLGNYYCEKRQVPPQNLLRINWAGGAIEWTRSQFETVLRAPLDAMLSSRQLTNQIEYVLLSMDIPYRIFENTGVPETGGYNSTTSALFYGFKPDGCSTCPAGLPSCNLAPTSANLYAGSEAVFRQKPPVSAVSNSWLAMMLTFSNLAQAKAIVDRGVESDFTFPTQKIALAKSQDVNRNVRYVLFDNTILNLNVGGQANAFRTNTDISFGLGTMLGYENGLQSFTIYGSFAPGAMADSLTSYGGDLFEDSEHTDALDFLIAGATASYGTVVEPCNYLEKFPSTMNYFYQSRGFSIAESYYQSLTNPYQGILVGEPLAAPFALPCSGGWSNAPWDSVLSGTTNLALGFQAADAARPVQQVDLFVDGLWAQTITNMPPPSHNILYVIVNGFQTNYTVPVGASLQTVASNLAVRLNGASYSSATKVAAFAHGDRIELQSMNLNVPGANLTVNTSNAIGTASLLATLVTASRSNFVDTAAFGYREFDVIGPVVTNDYLSLTVTRTNGAITTVSVTNQSPTATLSDFLQSLLTAVNSDPALTSGDGVVAEDLLVGQTGNGDPAAQFNLRARAMGWKEAQVQAQLSGSFTINPTTTVRLEDNLNDLRPRNHLYVKSGLPNLALTFPFDTTTNADGYHELAAVAYEGSHVRTQKRITRNVRIQNNDWSATLTCLVGGTNTALEATLQFAVAADTGNITRIELFSTGGSLGASNNVANTIYSIPASYLGVGLHPFYAVVTRNDGKAYRTDTKWIRIVGDELPFNISTVDSLPTLVWPATAGRSYQVLSTTDLTNTFTLRAIVTPTNSMGLWSETNRTSPQRLYRVKTP